MYLNQSLKSNIPLAARQNSKVKIYSDGTNIALLEYNFSFNFWQIVIEEFSKDGKCSLTKPF